jgi:multidrug efflux pump subunit AcrB
MSVALLTSLVLALAFTPVLAERFVRAKPNDEPKQNEKKTHGRFLGAIIRRYESVLSICARQPLDRNRHDRRGACRFLSSLSFTRLGVSARIRRECVCTRLSCAAGSSLAETDRMLQHVEEMLLKTPEIESYSRRTGLEMGLFVTEPNTGDFAVKLKPGHKRSTEEVIAELREQIAEAEPALD